MIKKRAILGAILWLGCSLALQAREIHGAGASLPANAYQEWIALYEKSHDTKIDYLAIGSGGGIKQVRRGVVDFGASEEPLRPEELEGRFLQFPALKGAIAIVYHLPEIPDATLRLTPEILAQIYLGKITHWDDSRLRALNPTLALPPLPIIPLHRHDGSGTTLAFTRYLSAHSPTWKRERGEGKALSWEIGQGARGNRGMSALLAQTHGALGYIELSHKQENRLHAAKLPSQDDPNLWLAPSDSPYPLITPSYIIIPLKNPKAREVLRFFEYALEHGDETLKRLGYFPLSPEEKREIKAAWHGVKPPF